MSNSFTYVPMKPEIEITQLISLFHERFPKNFYFGGESHDFWELVYVDKGQLLVTAENEKYLLKAGELAFHKPNEFHALCAYENIAANAIISSFVCNNPCMKYFEHRFTLLNSKERSYLYEALKHRDAIFANPDSNEIGAHLLVKNNLELLLIHLLRRANSTLITSRNESHLHENHAKQLTEKIDKYLEMHLIEKLTLKQIATALGYSDSYITKTYRQQTGKSIIESFIEMRMWEARRQIHEGNMGITQIATNLGYDNPAYFSRLFKQVFDMTPSECARSYRENTPPKSK